MKKNKFIVSLRYFGSFFEKMIENEVIGISDKDAEWTFRIEGGCFSFYNNRFAVVANGDFELRLTGRQIEKIIALSTILKDQPVTFFIDNWLIIEYIAL